MIEPGWYRMSSEIYHATEALSHSGIVRLRISPAHYRVPVEPTKAMEFGSAFHTAILEPEVFADKYTTRPEGLDGRTAAGKAWMAANCSKTILSHEDGQKIEGMRQALKESRAVQDLLCDGEPEVSGFWYDPQYPDLLCKIRADWLNRGKRILVDLKKCTDARRDKFMSDAWKYGYTVEAGWYLYGASQITRIEHREFYFIAVESESPFGVQVHPAGEDFIQEGLIECQKMIEVYRECRATNHYPCYPDVIQPPLSIPTWAKKRTTFENPIFD